MAKRATAFELVLPLLHAGRLARRWLYDALRTEILEGRLRPEHGFRLRAISPASTDSRGGRSSTHSSSSSPKATWKAASDRGRT
jgi:hypothetical protein